MSATKDSVSLRDYVEARLDEVHRANELAERERVRAADVLAAALSRRIDVAATAADRLELERIGSVREELRAAISAATEATRKAELATEKRFENVNEWRGQSADRERSQQEQTGTLMASFMPREVAEAMIADNRKQIEALQLAQVAHTSRDKGRSGEVAESREEQVLRTQIRQLHWTMIAIVSSAMIAIIIAIITHGFHAAAG